MIDIEICGVVGTGSSSSIICLFQVDRSYSNLDSWEKSLKMSRKDQQNSSDFMGPLDHEPCEFAFLTHLQPKFPKTWRLVFESCQKQGDSF